MTVVTVTLREEVIGNPTAIHLEDRQKDPPDQEVVMAYGLAKSFKFLFFIFVLKFC